MADNEQGDVQAAIEAGREQVREIAGHAPAGVVLVSRPDDHTLEWVDLGWAQPAPRRATGMTVTEDVRSFIEAVKLLGTDLAVVYAHADGTMTAVINDSRADLPGWRDLQVKLIRPQARAFTEWLRIDGKGQTQYELANFIEDHLAQIVEPAGADLLEIAQTFKASRRLSFRSQNVLRNGQVQVSYIEELEGGGGDLEGRPEAKLAIPEVITVRLRPYRDEEPADLTARLRWNLRERAVSFTLRFPDLADWLDTIHDAAIEQVAADLPDVQVLRGHE